MDILKMSKIDLLVFKNRKFTLLFSISKLCHSFINQYHLTNSFNNLRFALG